ncbi:hypothetical protein M6B38_345475 [Iris pallida]|uniref:Uncharacterized protein n=1 Tax=Iris pallida TaxID=29817 RepID=A0AAX6GU73_IRIPA|nr:hypothetical protein M6B38_345475 [Iris pallida]
MWCTEEGGTADRCTGSDLRPPPRLRRTGSTLAAWRGEAAHVALGERNHGASLRTEMARDAGAELGGGIVEVAVTTCMVWQRGKVVGGSYHSRSEPGQIWPRPPCWCRWMKAASGDEAMGRGPPPGWRTKMRSPVRARPNQKEKLGDGALANPRGSGRHQSSR